MDCSDSCQRTSHKGAFGVRIFLLLLAASPSSVLFAVRLVRGEVCVCLGCDDKLIYLFKRAWDS
jgi:hypothetical protein